MVFQPTSIFSNFFQPFQFLSIPLNLFKLSSTSSNFLQSLLTSSNLLQALRPPIYTSKQHLTNSIFLFTTSQRPQAPSSHVKLQKQFPQLRRVMTIFHKSFYTFIHIFSFILNNFFYISHTFRLFYYFFCRIFSRFRSISAERFIRCRLFCKILHFLFFLLSILRHFFILFYNVLLFA